MTSSAKNDSSATETTVPLPTVQELLTRIAAVEQKLEELNRPTNKSQREMTDADAKSVLTGQHKDLSHNKAADALGLSYGQVYSCRGEYTFRHIHKELRNMTPPWVNPWKKA